MPMMPLLIAVSKQPVGLHFHGKIFSLWEPAMIRSFQIRNALSSTTPFKTGLSLYFAESMGFETKGSLFSPVLRLDETERSMTPGKSVGRLAKLAATTPITCEEVLAIALESPCTYIELSFNRKLTHKFMEGVVAKGCATFSVQLGAPSAPFSSSKASYNPLNFAFLAPLRPLSTSTRKVFTPFEPGRVLEA